MLPIIPTLRGLSIALSIVVFSCSICNSQTILNGIPAGTSAGSDPAVGSAAVKREKELLERIDRMEKRLAELERLIEVAGLSDEKVRADGVTAKVTATSVAPPADTAGPPAASSSNSTANSKTAATTRQDKPKLLQEGLLPHSIKIPGTDLSVRLSGYVKTDVNQDFEGIGNQSQFSTNTIPINGSSNADLGGGTTIQARETRFSMELANDPEKNNFRLYVEGDFYGEGNAFRLRHAYGEYGPLLVGQTWTTFQDFSARPKSLDYEGPDGEIFVRQAMIRWSHKFNKNWGMAMAAESATVQILTPSGFTGTARGNVPDFTGNVRYHNKRFHTQLGWVLRNLKFDGTGATPDSTVAGWGFNSTFKVNTFGKDQLMGQFAFGSGIGRYIESFSGQNVDAFFAGNKLTSLPARSAVIGYERHWTPTIMSAFSYSISDLSTNTGLASSAIRRTQDARANLIWTPFNLVDFGVEVLWGRRDNQNGGHGDAVRIMFSSIYRFN